MKTIVFQPAAAKAYDALPAEQREAILEALVKLAISGQGDVKPITGKPGLFRVRIGRYRAMFMPSATEIMVVYVGKRDTTTYR